MTVLAGRVHIINLFIEDSMNRALLQGSCGQEDPGKLCCSGQSGKVRKCQEISLPLKAGV